MAWVAGFDVLTLANNHTGDYGECVLRPDSPCARRRDEDYLGRGRMQRSPCGRRSSMQGPCGSPSSASRTSTRSASPLPRPHPVPRGPIRRRWRWRGSRSTPPRRRRRLLHALGRRVARRARLSPGAARGGVHRSPGAQGARRAPPRARAGSPADRANARRVDPRELRVPVERRDRAQRDSSRCDSTHAAYEATGCFAPRSTASARGCYSATVADLPSEAPARSSATTAAL